MGKTFIIAVICFLIDQISKWAVLYQLNLKNVLAMDVWPPFLNFRMGWNYGINFGLFNDLSEITRWALIAVALAITLGVILYSRGFKGWRAALLFGAIIGGALANALDRVIYGAVADFLNMSCCGINNPFAFNLADVFIFMGAFGLVLFSEKLDKRA